jgi:TrmH family RNA methyltransferase
MGSNLLTLARDLQRRRARRRRRLALVEGWRLVEEALDAELTVRGALIDEDMQGRGSAGVVLRRLADHAVPVEDVPTREFAQVCSTETPQGILAMVEPPSWELAEIVPGPTRPVLVVDGVQDPGNVGALLRTAHALGAAGAVMLPGTADVTNPRVIRGAMGSTFRFPTVALSHDQLASWAETTGLTVLVTDAEGVPLDRVERGRVVAVVVGNEGAGIRPEMRALADHVVSVPLAAGVESLNVAVAAGIVLHEVRRV